MDIKPVNDWERHEGTESAYSSKIEVRDLESYNKDDEYLIISETKSNDGYMIEKMKSDDMIGRWTTYYEKGLGEDEMKDKVKELMKN